MFYCELWATKGWEVNFYICHARRSAGQNLLLNPKMYCAITCHGGTYRFAGEVRIFVLPRCDLCSTEVRIFVPLRCASFCCRGAHLLLPRCTSFATEVNIFLPQRCVLPPRCVQPCQPHRLFYFLRAVLDAFPPTLRCTT